jgi:TonB family protein
MPYRVLALAAALLTLPLAWSAAASNQTVAATGEKPDGEELMNRVASAIAARNLDDARALLAQVERLNPKQAKLWAYYGYLATTSGDLNQAIEDYKKEIQFHPDEIPAYRELAMNLTRLGRRDEAIEAWRIALAAEPKDQLAATQVATLMMQAKRYAEIPEILEKPIAAAPDRYNLQVLRARALIQGGRKDEGIAEAQKIAAATADPLILNNLAYSLADTGVSVDLAREWAQRALNRTEQDTAKASLTSVQRKDIAAVILLGEEWDTLGWAYFRQGDIATAEKFVYASWQLSQHAEVADHLGQIYEKEGRHEAAIHMWQLAVASNRRYEGAPERLRSAGVPESDVSTSSEASRELGRLRTLAVPAIQNRVGSADFFVLISRQGIEDVRLIGTSAFFNDAADAIRSGQYGFPFPDEGPEKIIRSGTLYCSTYTTPGCQLTMLLPSSTPVGSVQPNGGALQVLPPTLRTRVEPKYTEAARKAQLEGTVLLSIVINEDGIPEQISIINSLGMGLDESAKDCVAKWRFNPATKDGRPVRSIAKVEVNFVLIKRPQQ